MQLSLAVEGQEGVTWPQWVDLARACEKHSISALFRSDHYLSLSDAHPDRGSLEAWATISALAAVTEHIHLGTLVSPATFRHPSTLAKLVTTADRISGGRIELGLGAGWYRQEHLAYGFPFPSQAERLDRLAEYLQLILGAWQPGPFSFQGAHYAVENLRAQPKPVQLPHPPIILGGRGGPRSTELAARYADEYNFEFGTLQALPAFATRLARATADVGRERIPISIEATLILGRRRSDVIDRIRHIRGIDLTAAQAFVESPPSGWIVGTVLEAADQLVRLGEAGVSRVFCWHPDHQDLDGVALIGELARYVARESEQPSAAALGSNWLGTHR